LVWVNKPSDWPTVGISLKTVDSYRATMMKKVRVSNAAQLLKEALEQGLVKIE
jgi:DNA-binding CsgD family transcriptional regulator